jgi:hypothetical protein
MTILMAVVMQPLHYRWSLHYQQCPSCIASEQMLCSSERDSIAYRGRVWVRGTGGAAIFENAAVAMEGGACQTNQACFDGGAMFMKKSSINIRGTPFSGNQVSACMEARSAAEGPLCCLRISCWRIKCTWSALVSVA